MRCFDIPVSRPDGGAAPGSLPLMPQELERLQAGLSKTWRRPAACRLDIAHGFSPPPQRNTLTGRVPGSTGSRRLQTDTVLRELLTRFHAQVLRDLDAADCGPLVLQMPRDDGSRCRCPTVGVRDM